MRAGGGLVFALAGVAIAALGREKRENFLLGIGLVPFGLTYVLTNLLASEAWTSTSAMATILLRGGCAVAIAGAMLADERLRAIRGRVLLGAAALVAVALAPLVDPAARADFYLYSLHTPIGVTELAAYFAVMAVLLAYAGGLVLAARRGAAAGTAVLAAGLALFPAFDLGTNLPHIGIRLAATGGPLWTLTAWLAAIAVIATAAAWAASGTRRAYLVGWALLGACVVGVATGGFEARTGAPSPMYGLVRIAAAGTLAYGIFRADLLRVPLPRLAAQRGTLASLALVGFFVVAQVAQEFLSDSMGVVLGGAAAGALLFAAVPLQRAAERLADRDPPVSLRPRDGSRVADSERAYKIALARFLADGSLLPEEELALAHLADEAGLSIRRATEIRHEVEREFAARGQTRP